ncbi:hypothetical protein J1N35_014986 [Gossypium stocksii]|uniref:Uncharacterized protein n=1 Tax=Gossypium stocksii TaxID=47602 RepID=A0A9D3VV38_9ROSI|nr:hypothetical protein J1N35_014986 [Gossypium stocksii]
MKLRSFAFVEFTQGGVVGLDINLLTASTDNRVVIGARIGQGSKDSSSGVDSLSRKLDKIMDIDSLVGNVRKKRKTTVGAVHIGFVSEEERNSAQLEHRSKKKADSIGSPIVVADDTSPLATRVSSLVPIARGTPIGVETKAEGLEREVAVERESKEALRVELDELTIEHAMEIDRIIRECQDQVKGTTREHFQVFEDFKKKTANNVLRSISKLKMNILLHAQITAGAACDFFSSTWGSPNFYIEDDPFTNEDVVPSTMNNDLTPSDHQTKSFAFIKCLGGCGSSYANLNMIVGSFALANYFGGYGSSPVNLNMIVGSFALANCFRGYGSSPVNLNMTVESFALANCFGGYDSSPANLNMTTRSFALTNYFGGCSSSLANLNMTTR